MSELAEKLKAMGWRQVVTIIGRAELPHDTFYVNFKLRQPNQFSSPSNRTQNWRGELRLMPTGKWLLFLRSVVSGYPGRETEVLDVFDDPVAATVALKVEGSGSIARGIQAWRSDTFGWLPGELEEVT